MTPSKEIFEIIVERIWNRLERMFSPTRQKDPIGFVLGG